TCALPISVCGDWYTRAVGMRSMTIPPGPARGALFTANQIIPRMVRIGQPRNWRSVIFAARRHPSIYRAWRGLSTAPARHRQGRKVGLCRGAFTFGLCQGAFASVFVGARRALDQLANWSYNHIERW